MEPWKQSDGKNYSITHWYEGNIKRRWNSTQANWIYFEEEDAEEQIGSVFAVQGIDLTRKCSRIYPIRIEYLLYFND